MIDILPLILRKKAGQPMTKVDFVKIVKGFSDDKISDAQMAAFFMVLQFQPLSDQEILLFFDAIYDQSTKIDLSHVKNFKIDKHASGGIGDKITLTLIPLFGSLGIKLYKYSGRRLGYTGGTIDKLSAFPHIQLEYDALQFMRQASHHPIIVADNKVISKFESKAYRLRSLTGTLEPISLIVCSIMIKKLLLNNDALILDLKVGSGTVFKTLSEARNFARLARLICQRYQRPLRIIFSDMNQPLGNTIGNKLEVLEVFDLLQGKGDPRLRELVITIASHAVVLKNNCDLEQAEQIVRAELKSPRLLTYFEKFVTAQHGDFQTFMNQPVKSKQSIAVKANQDGYLHFQNIYELGNLFNQLSVDLEDQLDVDAGIILHAKHGHKVAKNQVLMTLKTNFMLLNPTELIQQAHRAFSIRARAPVQIPSIVLDVLK